MSAARFSKKFVVERVQTGVRMEKRLLKVLKAFAEFHDLSLGDLLEGIVLHAFDGKAAFQEASRKRIKQLKKFYGLDLDARASHRLTEVSEVAHKSRLRGAAKKKVKRPEPAKSSPARAKKRRPAGPVRTAPRRKGKKGGNSR
jgi:hypothetical protein